MIQKRIVTLLIIMLSCFNLCLINGEEVINMRHIGHHGNHNEYYPPADMPVVYYDTDDQEIILVADGYADYYDVDIISLSTMTSVISTQVDGYGDSIDISLIPDDNYRIVITSSNNNVYEGQFTNY